MKLRVACTIALAGIALHVRAQNAPCPTPSGSAPTDIQAIFDKPMYKSAVWALQVVDLETGKTLIDTRPHCHLYIGSVRKVFSVGELLDEVGPRRRYDTPVYGVGRVDKHGVLNGDLILVASGDLTMGGRTNPDGSIAVTNYDHNEANSLGNAVLSKPDPLAGYAELARQVARAGVRRVSGEVIIDDRLFRPFNFRGEFNVTPIFVNDDAVDITVNPTTPGKSASVTYRPVSSALSVESTVTTGGPGSEYSLRVAPPPPCIGTSNCVVTVGGQLPVDFVPPLTGTFPLVQMARITSPSNYARTIFVEALRSAGVQVEAPAVEINPRQRLPGREAYPKRNKLAELTGSTYAEDAKLILKVSYNIGADTSLVLFGLEHGKNSLEEALRFERESLSRTYGIPRQEFTFVDGSGGGETTATTEAVTLMLRELAVRRRSFPEFERALPRLGIDGSLAFVKDFASDPSLAPAAGKVLAKTGTYLVVADGGALLKGQALAGYIRTRSGHVQVYTVIVNNVAVKDLSQVMQVFQDEGTISAILWRDQ